MANLNGDWFHSRSSSSLSELLTVRRLVLESQKPEYIGFGWSRGRTGNVQMHKFAAVANIQPSTMQTKIRAMIRYGFIKHGNTCPLIFTRMGSLWNDLHSIGNYSAAKNIYELTLGISLAIFAFNDSPEQYSINPAEGEMPLKFLFNNLDDTNSISIETLSVLVDGRTSRIGLNLSYWQTDLVNAGLFITDNNYLKYTGKYESLVKQIKSFSPDPSLSDETWGAIRNNPLLEESPFKESVRAIFEELSKEEDIEKQIIDETYTAPLIDVISEQDDIIIPDVDILSNEERFSTSTRRIRNATWSIRIKRKYNYRCSVPKCDVIGQVFVEAAHIKPDNVRENGTPHRTHILNGLCLCKHCHVAFDKGYFSLTNDCRIIASAKFREVVDQNLKTVILSSSNQTIKDRDDHRYPLSEFLCYHRTHRFMEGA